MDTILAGFSDAFTLSNVLFVLLGILIGQLFAAAPGVGSLIAITIAVPYTFYMSPVAALGFLIGINKGGTIGGAVSAILMNTPGSPEATASTFDGYPMTQQGKARKALRAAHFSSVTGDTLSDLVLIFVAAPLSMVAMKMGPPEMAAVILVALVIIAGLVGNSMIKGLIAAFLGLFMSLVGMDQSTAAERLTFGIPELMDGISITAAGIGVLALGEILRQIVFSASLPRLDQKNSESVKSGEPFTWQDFRTILPTILRSTMIGTMIGAIPGIGSSAAGFLGYTAAKRASKNPERFGKGEIRGVAASEAANSSVVGANFIPLLSLGIPGNVAAAIILGAFLIHGITPGPQLFSEQPRLIYSLFAVMLIGDLLNLITGLFTMGFFARVIRIPLTYIIPCVVVLCITGVIVADSLFDAWLLIAMAVAGFFMRMLNFSFVTFIIGYVLGPMFEEAFGQAMIMADGDPLYLFERPIACVFILLAVVVLVSLLRQHRRAGRAMAVMK
ncbi:tripartite tricarboxylate transporter permease [Alloalcanivorax sp. C16-2]|uniref:tripartite tricarboxylate transporter permease n=1 Tax=Alloalcanivorax TaxID=3020832 RepID=UPI001932D07B|nr:tripartite tricarboxylate transporter permease [Alloalcanivorax marinus]MBL7250256.1 tripartite tricarboxylate transporter permease [Alloalcanivorax marinus]